MNLLPVKISDDNKKLSDLPDGIFAYIGADGLHKFEGGFNPINLKVRADINKTARKTEWYFKINKYSSDKITFTGYISDQADSLINQRKDILSNDIQVFPLKFNEYIHEKEFNLNDTDLVVRPRYISTDGGPGEVQWLVDVKKERINNSEITINKDEIKEILSKEVFKNLFYKVSKNKLFLVSISTIIVITVFGFKFSGVQIGPFSFSRPDEKQTTVNDSMVKDAGVVADSIIITGWEDLGDFIGFLSQITTFYKKYQNIYPVEYQTYQKQLADWQVKVGAIAPHDTAILEGLVKSARSQLRKIADSDKNTYTR